MVPAAVFAMLVVGVAYGLVIEGLSWGDELGSLHFFNHESTGVVVAASLLAIVAAPIFEEMFFRGFIFQGLMRRLNPAKAALVTSSVFALAHIHPITYVPTFFIGLLLALVFYKTRSLLLSMACHSLYNGIVVAIALALDSEAQVRVYA